MAGSMTGLQMLKDLLTGGMSSAQLETALTTNSAQYLGAWTELLSSKSADAMIKSGTAMALAAASDTALADLMSLKGAEIAASDAATKALAENASAIKNILENSTYLAYWRDVPANNSRLDAYVNAVGSALKRWVYNSDDTWSKPDGLLALSVAAQGHGGQACAGDTQASPYTNRYGGAGGGGGETATKVFSSAEIDALGSTVAVTVPAAGSGSPAAFGAHLSANPGSDAVGGNNDSNDLLQPVAGAGGGSDSSPSSIYGDLENEFFQYATASKKGGDGGDAGRYYGVSSSCDQPTAGGDGASGSGGAAGLSTTGNNDGSAGSAGTGYGSGGGGGGASNNMPDTAGEAATDPGCGGGGSYSYTLGAVGAQGGPSQVVVYGVVEA